MKGKSQPRNWDQLRDSPGRLQLGGIPLGLLLFDLVLQDGHLGPARYGMGGDPSAEADALLGYTKSVAPERVTLGEGASENSVLGNSLSFTFHHAALCHAYDLFSLNHANQLRIILVINNSMICAGDQPDLRASVSNVPYLLRCHRPNATCPKGPEAKRITCHIFSASFYWQHSFTHNSLRHRIGPFRS